MGELDGDGRARRAPEPVPRVVERGLGAGLRDDGRAADGEQRVLGPQPRLPRVVLVGVDDGDALRLRRRRRGPGDDEADAAVAALDALDQVARLARALELRVRVERRQHAGDGGLEERLGRHRVDVAAVERVEDDRELRRGLARLAALAARRVAEPEVDVQRPRDRLARGVGRGDRDRGGAAGRGEARAVRRGSRRDDDSDDGDPCEEDAHVPHVVHRLDMDTSGVVVYARSDLALRRLNDAFRCRTVKKRYEALLCGHLPSPGGGGSENPRKMAVIHSAAPPSQGARG